MSSELLQNNLIQVQRWIKKWRIKTNKEKSVYITFMTRKETYPPVKLDGKQIPQSEEVRHLGRVCTLTESQIGEITDFLRGIRLSTS